MRVSYARNAKVQVIVAFDQDKLLIEELYIFKNPKVYNPFGSYILEKVETYEDLIYQQNKRVNEENHPLLLRDNPDILVDVEPTVIDDFDRNRVLRLINDGDITVKNEEYAGFISKIELNSLKPDIVLEALTLACYDAGIEESENLLYTTNFIKDLDLRDARLFR